MCPNVHGRFNSNKSVADKVKDAAKEFKADGKIGSKFTSEGEVGKKFDQEVGGAFAKGKSLCKKKKKSRLDSVCSFGLDGAIGKQFEKDGAVGGTGQKAAEKTEKAAKDAK